MSAARTTRRSLALALVLVSPACRDATSAPYGEQETIVVSIIGVNGNDVGVVMRLPYTVLSVESPRRSLEVAWASDDDGGTRIAVIGDLATWGHHAIVRRLAASEQAPADVIEVADDEGQLVDASAVRAVAWRLGS